MNHSINKWQQNKQKCIQGSLSGTEWCDSWHLLSYRYSLSRSSLSSYFVSLSLALSTLSHTHAYREWVTWNKLSYRWRCFLQPDGQYAVLGSQATFRLTSIIGQTKVVSTAYSNLWAVLKNTPIKS